MLDPVPLVQRIREGCRSWSSLWVASKRDTGAPRQAEDQHGNPREERGASVGKEKRFCGWEATKREEKHGQLLPLETDIVWEAGQCCQGGVGGPTESWEGRRLGKLICRGRGC